MSEPLLLTVPAEAAGERLDRWLAASLAERSRSEIQRWIKEGAVTVDEETARANHRLSAGERVAVEIPEVVEDDNAPQPENIPLTIVYEDDDLLVIDKPAGLVVHPAPGHATGTLVNAVLHHAPDIEGVGGARRPGLVHRLDRETSGLIVVAKHDRAHRFLQVQFKDRTVYKEYLALVEGQMEPPEGRLNAPMGRHPVDRKRQAILPPDPLTGEPQGREAVTDYHSLATYSAPGNRLGLSSGAVAHFSLLRVVLHTGRTHQIRVHLAWQKHPVVGDTLYGYRKQRLPLDRQFLHAHKLRLQLLGGEEHEFVAELPAELKQVLAWLKAG